MEGEVGTRGVGKGEVEGRGQGVGAGWGEWQACRAAHAKCR